MQRAASASLVPQRGPIQPRVSSRASAPGAAPGTTPRPRAQSSLSASSSRRSTDISSNVNSAVAKAQAGAERDQNRMLLQNTAFSEGQLEIEVAKIEEKLKAEFAEMHAQLLQEQTDFMTEMGTARVRSESNRQQLDAEKAQLASMRQQLEQELEAARARSNQNRQDLDVDKASIASMQQEILQNRQDLGAEKAELKSIKQEIKQDMASVKQVKQELSDIKADQMQTMNTVKQEVAEMKQHKPALESLKDLKPELASMKKEVTTVKQLKQDMEEMKQLKQDVTKLKQDIQESKSLKPEIAKLKEGLKSNDELVRLKSKADLTAIELKDLVTKLYDSGVLSPTRLEPVPEEAPPVGTIELTEDIFSARLLLRLGFMKGGVAKEGSDDELRENTEQREFRRGYGECDSDDSEKACFDDVTGIVVPDVEVGGWAYVEVTTGWLFICLLTILMQLTILLIMMRSYISQSGKCFEGDALSWWLLHVSRCMATVVAGALTTKELMDTVNYWMISELLEPKISYEVVLTTLVRVLTQCLIVAASVFLFLSSTDPAETWMNMTALGFIATLGQDILEVAKRGVFGHHIQGTITSLNYQLNMEHDYPSWFKTVRYLTIFISVIGIVAFATFTFIREDPPCHEVSHHTHQVVNATVGLLQPGLGADARSGGDGRGGSHHNR